MLRLSYTILKIDLLKKNSIDFVINSVFTLFVLILANENETHCFMSMLFG